MGGSLRRCISNRAPISGASREAGLPEFMIQHFCAVALDYQNGLFSGEDKFIAELTGKPPMSVQDFLASHREAFETKVITSARGSMFRTIYNGFTDAILLTRRVDRHAR